MLILLTIIYFSLYYEICELKKYDFTESKEMQPILSQKNAFAGSEETHFLFYFGIMTLLSMLFYLALYNKKKVSI